MAITYCAVNLLLLGGFVYLTYRMTYKEKFSCEYTYQLSKYSVVFSRPFKLCSLRLLK